MSIIGACRATVKSKAHVKRKMESWKNRKCKTMKIASRKRSPHCMGVIFRRKTMGHSNISRRIRYKTKGGKNESEQDHNHSTISIYSIENRYKISSKKRSPWSMGVKIDEKPISHSNVSEKASTEWRFQTLFYFSTVLGLNKWAGLENQRLRKKSRIESRRQFGCSRSTFIDVWKKSEPQRNPNEGSRKNYR